MVELRTGTQCELCCGAGGLVERTPPSQHSLLGKVKVMWRVRSREGEDRQRPCVSNFTLFLGRVSNQRGSRKFRLPVHEGMIPPGRNRWPEKKFQNRSIKCGVLPYDPAIPLLGKIPYSVKTDSEYMCSEVDSSIIHNSKKWKQPPNSIYI